MSKGPYYEKYQAFYNSAEWRYTREFVFRSAKKLCERCLKKGKVKEGTIAHHIEPIETKEGWRRRLDITNLMCVCKECHNAIHDRQSPLQKFNKFWEKLNAESAESKS